MKSPTKYSQAAMEFLLTYGWAILVALVILAYLAYIGILSPDKYLPESCIITAPGLSCRDHSVSYERYPFSFSPYKNILRLYIVNNGGYLQTLKRLKIQQNINFPELPYQNLAHDLNPGQAYLIELDLQKTPPILSGKNKVTVEFVLEVENPQTGLTHTFKGNVRTGIT